MYKFEASFDDDGTLLCIFLRLNKGKVHGTRVLCSEQMIFADYDRKGRMLSIEFTEPMNLKIDKKFLAQLSEEKTNRDI